MATTHLKNYIDGRWVDSSSVTPSRTPTPANRRHHRDRDEIHHRRRRQGRRVARGGRTQLAALRPKRGEILYRAGEICSTQRRTRARDDARDGKVLAESKAMSRKAST